LPGPSRTEKAILGGKVTNKKELLQEQDSIRKVVDELWKEDKTIRDPVHGDIEVNHLEVRIIDTSAFQRLRRIKQLGVAHLVYPGAEHSRFQHSLGTLHMAKRLLRSALRNRFSDVNSLGDETKDKVFEMVTRLAALLHDAYEFPFSHTLEKEGRIMDSQWTQAEISKKLIGAGSEIYGSVYDYVKDLCGNLGADSKLAGQLTSYLLATSYLIITLKEKTPDLQAAFNSLGYSLKESDIPDILKIDREWMEVANDIVLNTICADLLDYLARDFYFCGIPKKYDDRFIKYAVIFNDDGKRTFAYRIVSKRNEVKHSIVSGLLELMELRYLLHELVHAHRTKNSFSAMIIEAFNFYYQELQEDPKRLNELNEFTEKLFLNMGDDELLQQLGGLSTAQGGIKNSTSQYILDYYFKRRPFIGVPLIIHDKRYESAIERPRERYYLEKILPLPLKEEGAREGDILLYAAPDLERVYKPFETKVVWYNASRGRPEITTFEAIRKQVESLQPTFPEYLIKRVESFITALRESYKNLQRSYLYVSPKLEPDLPKIQKVLSTVCRGQVLMNGILPEYVDDKLSKIEHELTAKGRTYSSFKDIYEVFIAHYGRV
jgi:HD superfamily phosphohydrolase